MTRVLLVGTASPKRVADRARQMLGTPGLELTILCCHGSGLHSAYAAMPGVEVVPLLARHRARILADLRKRRFDVVHMFWTGERAWRKMKVLALTIPSAQKKVESGDGGIFDLTWKACIRHWQFRRLHPLPSDHWSFLPDTEPDAASRRAGQRILIVQSADPLHVLRALENLRDHPQFCNPEYTLFSRNRPECLKSFSGHPMLHEIIVHSEIRSGWKHWIRLRRERFDGVVFFLTGDPSYWKIKYLPFLLGIHHKLIYNENGDCFFFSVGRWVDLIAHRMGERSRLGVQAGWAYRLRIIVLLLLKAVLLPFRFVWLLWVWVRLRCTA
jgi:hypothetical protein